MKGCCLAISLPFLIAALMFAITLVTGIGQPFSEVLSQASSDAGQAFVWTILGEILVGFFLAVTYPAWRMGQHIYDLFFG